MAKPHPLPLARKWREDYRRWARDGCPTPEQAAAAPALPPDLQELVERAGGYDRITAEQWAEFDRQMADWQVRRRARVEKL